MLDDRLPPFCRNPFTRGPQLKQKNGSVGQAMLFCRTISPFPFSLSLFSFPFLFPLSFFLFPFFSFLFSLFSFLFSLFLFLSSFFPLFCSLVFSFLYSSYSTSEVHQSKKASKPKGSPVNKQPGTISDGAQGFGQRGWHNVFHTPCIGDAVDWSVSRGVAGMQHEETRRREPLPPPGNFLVEAQKRLGVDSVQISHSITVVWHEAGPPHAEHGIKQYQAACHRASVNSEKEPAIPM